MTADASDKLPAWSVTLRSGAKVRLIRDQDAERNVLEFESGSDGSTTTIVLSDAALAAVVALAVTKAGVPVHAG